MIEVIEKENASSDYDRYKIRIDGKICDYENSKVLLRPAKADNIAAEGITVSISEAKLSRHVATHRFREIPESIKKMSLETRYSILDPRDSFFQDISILRNESGTFHLDWNIAFYLVNWKEAFSVADYYKEALDFLADSNLRTKKKGVLGLGFSIEFPVENLDSTIVGEFLRHEEEIKKLHNAIMSSLTSKFHRQSVSMFFDFPEEVKVACEQYLLYFGQFLKDLGVKADTALTHAAGQVLFTITPADEKEALDKIRSALDVYLHLPSSPISDTQNESISAQRLEANILRLRSDLKLAAAELQAKDSTIQAKETTIEAQQLIINVQKRLLSGEILVDSLKDVTPRPEDKEDLIDGVVALSVYKEKGFEINLGEVLRRFKKLFSKKEP